MNAEEWHRQRIEHPDDSCWPDPLLSPMAEVLRRRGFADCMLEVYELFDKLERELNAHRGFPQR